MKKLGKNKKAVVLLSGGLDSSVVLALASQKFQKIYCISFDYGQRHKRELEYAKKQVQNQNIKFHKIFKIDFFGGSSLTDKIDVPQNESVELIPKKIPITYVPARNTIFLSYALGYSEFVNSTNIFLGVNAVDYSGYPDCRPEFIKIFEKLSNIATKKGIEGQKFKIHTPLINLTKKEIILLGIKYKVDFKYTASCYNPINNIACGSCDSCLLRKKGFNDAKITDPVKYIK
tara:strand:- start:709 stop:1401 length:693 start_codon:yes stop_codon:yes gene_type:complete